MEKIMNESKWRIVTKPWADPMVCRGTNDEGTFQLLCYVSDRDIAAQLIADQANEIEELKRGIMQEGKRTSTTKDAITSNSHYTANDESKWRTVTTSWTDPNELVSLEERISELEKHLPQQLARSDLKYWEDDGWLLHPTDNKIYCPECRYKAVILENLTASKQDLKFCAVCTNCNWESNAYHSLELACRTCIS